MLSLAGFPDEPVEDHFVHLRGVTWSDFERVLKMRGEKSVPRICYVEGTLELMRPSRSHEAIKCNLRSLVATWCLEADIEFESLGSWTVKKQSSKRAVEPDECWLFGPRDLRVQRPHLAVEVIWTSGGLEKLDVYRKLGVKEVWTWERGEIHIHVLRGERYVRAARSHVLPGIDVTLLASFVDRTTSEAIKGYRRALARPARKPRARS